MVPMCNLSCAQLIITDNNYSRHLYDFQGQRLKVTPGVTSTTLGRCQCCCLQILPSNIGLIITFNQKATHLILAIQATVNASASIIRDTFGWRTPTPNYTHSPGSGTGGPLYKGHIGTSYFINCREVVHSSEVENVLALYESLFLVP